MQQRGFKHDGGWNSTGLSNGNMKDSPKRPLLTGLLIPLTANKEVSSHRKTRIKFDISNSPWGPTHEHHLRNRQKEKENTFFMPEPGAP